MSADTVYTYLDPVRLPGVTAPELGVAAAGVFLEPPGTARHFRRLPPQFVDDPDHTGLFGSFSESTITYPPAFVAAATDAELVGFRTVLCPDGKLFNDDSVGDGPLPELHVTRVLGSEQTGPTPTCDGSRF